MSLVTLVSSEDVQCILCMWPENRKTLLVLDYILDRLAHF